MRKNTIIAVRKALRSEIHKVELELEDVETEEQEADLKEELTNLQERLAQWSKSEGESHDLQEEKRDDTGGASRSEGEGQQEVPGETTEGQKTESGSTTGESGQPEHIESVARGGDGTSTEQGNEGTNQRTRTSFRQHTR